MDFVAVSGLCLFLALLCDCLWSVIVAFSFLTTLYLNIINELGHVISNNVAF